MQTLRVRIALSSTLPRGVDYVFARRMIQKANQFLRQKRAGFIIEAAECVDWPQEQFDPYRATLDYFARRINKKLIWRFKIALARNKTMRSLEALQDIFNRFKAGIDVYYYCAVAMLEHLYKTVGLGSGDLLVGLTGSRTELCLSYVRFPVCFVELSCGEQPCAPEVYTLFLHEVFHAMGAQHTKRSNSIMYEGVPRFCPRCNPLRIERITRMQIGGFFSRKRPQGRLFDFQKIFITM